MDVFGAFLLLIAVATAQPTTNCKNRAAEIGIVLDTSVSLTNADFAKSKEFLQDLVQHFDVGPHKTRFSLIPFANGTHTEYAFNLDDNANKEELLSALANVQRFGRNGRGQRTDTGEGIDYLRVNQLSEDKVRAGIPKIGLVITDGQPTEQQPTLDAVNKAVEAGIELFAVGVGAISKDMLQQIAGGNADRVIYSPDYSQLEDIMNELTRGICKETPQADEPDCKDRAAEIGIVLDTSVSLSEDDFKISKEFLQDLVKHFNVGPENTRFSIIPYANGSHPQYAFGLGENSNQEQVLAALSKIKRDAGAESARRTDTGKAIMYMRENHLSADKVRAGVPKIGIVITDGNSQEPELTKSEAEAAVQDGIEMFAVGVGAVSGQELVNIAGGNKERVITSADFSKLQGVLGQLTSGICQNDEQACSPHDVYFVFSQADLDHSHTAWTVTFMSKLISHQPSFKYGTITDTCGAGFELGTFQDQESLLEKIRSYEDYSLPGLVDSLVESGFPEEGSEGRSQVAIIFLDSNEKSAASLAPKVQELLTQGVEVRLIERGDQVTTEIAGAVTLAAQCPVSLAKQVRAGLCAKSE